MVIIHKIPGVNCADLAVIGHNTMTSIIYNQFYQQGTRETDISNNHLSIKYVLSAFPLNRVYLPLY